MLRPKPSFYKGINVSGKRTIITSCNFAWYKSKRTESFHGFFFCNLLIGVAVFRLNGINVYVFKYLHDFIRKTFFVLKRGDKLALVLV